MKILKVVHLTWIDPDVIAGWHEMSEVPHEFEVIHTVGFLLDTRHGEHYVIASNYDPECDSANAITRIPWQCVRKVEEICVMKLK